MILASELQSFDGKDVAQGKRILAAYRPTAEILQELVVLIAAGDAVGQSGATWLLKAYLEDGAGLEAPLVAQLGRTLDLLEGWEGRLHVCQSVRFLRIPKRNASQFARFLRHCIASETKFLRAWGTDGFVRLARQHPSLEAEAHGFVEAALADPAASVRARARHLV